QHNGVNVGTKTCRGTAMAVYPNTKRGAPVDLANCAAPAGGAGSPPDIFVMQPDYQQPIVQQSNLNVEHQFVGDFSLNVGWQMVKGNHLQRTRDINLGTPVPTVYTIAGTGQTVTFQRYPSTRPIADFRRISQFESSANSLYHGMFVQLKKRMSRNFQGMLSYTWSHSIDDVPDATAVVPSTTDDAKMLFDPKCGHCDRSS